MNPRLSSIALGTLIVLSISLAFLSLQARTTKASLQQALAATQADLERASHQSVEEKSQIDNVNSALSGQQKILANSPGSLEVVRRASAMAVIESLKVAHQKSPPPPRPKQPPTGPSGWEFPELLSDPEYNRLYAQNQFRMIKSFDGPKVARLGLSAEIFERIISVLADHQMALVDYRAISGKSSTSGDFAKQQTEATNRQLKELMGEEAYARWEKLNAHEVVFTPNPNGTGTIGYGVKSHEALVADAKNYVLPTLALRLSYSEAPLQKDQTDSLAEILARCATGPTRDLSKALRDDAFIVQSAQVLSQPQVDALRQLKAEQDASDKRRKLPKSSELPRNTLPAK